MIDNLENSEDNIQLPDDTMKILLEFLKEKEERETSETTRSNNSAFVFEEDWNLSQFWYNKITIDTFARICKILISEISDSNGRIALLSCPSLYTAVKSVHSNVKLFEFDDRFGACGEDFQFYDYNNGNNDDYLIEYHNSFDIIIVDPPFLSSECLQKVGKIVANLGKSNTKTILNSGKTVEQWAKNFMNLKVCSFKPEHERNLGNEFCSFANFNLDKYL